MKTAALCAALVAVAVFAATAALAQAPQTVRLRGVIEAVNWKVCFACPGNWVNR